MDRIIVFAKNPKLGKVKTRLAKDLGQQRALYYYQELLKITESILHSFQDKKVIYWDEIPNDANLFFVQTKWNLQSEGDLGFRMATAFQKEFADGYTRILILGTDCPFLTPKIIEDAFSALEEADIVIGPSEDGGYYLLGLKRFYPELFQGIPWSTDVVFSLTMKIVHSLSLKCHILPVLRDIDDLQDFLIWKS